MIPQVPGHPTLWKPSPKLRRCRPCQVTWVSHEPECWVCGERVDPSPPPPSPVYATPTLIRR